MSIHQIARRAIATAGALLMTVSLGAGAAMAQSLWDWGGEEKVGGSGKQTVRFPTAQAPGQIFVSFTDRKLYLVTRPGEALSYPIATPREQSRWQGATSVTDKRVNPSWTPTPTMRAENPRLPMWVPGGHPMNPLGVRALYLGSSFYRIHGTDAPWTIGSARAPTASMVPTPLGPSATRCRRAASACTTRTSSTSTSASRSEPR